ncbi:MAG TPA: hypothetical protein VG225_09105 [Terracidiphilus sp.]|nr:hypothetical protein [Terracidiphilus sp.]
MLSMNLHDSSYFPEAIAQPESASNYQRIFGGGRPEAQRGVDVPKLVSHRSTAEQR